jgi:hypothetical protein
VSGRPRVDVRRARGGLELRVDGTLASLHRPGPSVTGTVWWALAAPVTLVERDLSVLRAARRHFRLDELGVELQAVDAREYLDTERRRFDLVIEDLFVGPVRAVRKPDWLVPGGYERIRRRLREGGIVSTNSIHESGAIVSAMRPFGSPVLSLEVRGHWNRILLCGRDLPPPRALRAHLRRIPPLARALESLAVRTPPKERSA